MAVTKQLSSGLDYAALLDKYDTWMFDCDGVLWHGDTLIDGATDVLDLLRRNGAQGVPLPLLCLKITRKACDLCHQQRYEISQELQEEV